MYYTGNSTIIYCLTNAFSEAKQATAEVYIELIQHPLSTPPLQKVILLPTR